MDRTWPRWVPVGALWGLALAFVGDERRAIGGDDCPTENECSFKKPNLAFVVEWTTAMTEDFVVGQTRWDAAVEGITSIVETDNGFFDETFHLALIRFAHDAEPAVAGTSGPGGLVDGVVVDVAWYDALSEPNGYFECNGAAIVDALLGAGPPCDGVACSPTYAWTAGGLARARTEIAQARADHPDDVLVGDERVSLVMLMTAGGWTTADGSTPADPDTDPDNPTLVADALYVDDGARVYAVALGDTAEADAIAMAGGTVTALDLAAGVPQEALAQVIDDVETQAATPDCTGAQPRLLFVLDASSSMLNVGDATMADAYAAGGMGQTPWDLARAVIDGVYTLSGPATNGSPFADVVHVALVAFAGSDEARIVVPYDICLEDAIAWATDPQTSCAAGCADPWGGPPIAWTFQLGAEIPCSAIDATSIMPLCEQEAADPDACTGSSKALHDGLAFANAYAQQYVDDPPAALDPTAPFVNVLLTDGRASDSTDAQVSAELVDMYANDGITTLVVGLGDDVDSTMLEALACWGSGGTGIPCTGGARPHYTAANLGELHDALLQVVAAAGLDPCCMFWDCTFFGHETGVCETTAGDSSSTRGGSSAGDSSSTTDAPATSTGSADVTTGSGSGSTSEPESGSSPSSTTSSGDPPVTTTIPPGGSTGETDTEAVASDDASGCGCSTPARSPDVLAFVMLALGLRRRR